MTAWNAWLWPDHPVLSALAMVAILIPVLYLAREYARRLVRALGLGFSQPLRLAGRALLAAADELRARNRQVLLAHGREEVARALEREFERLDTLVRRDLHHHPALQRRLLDDIARMEDDYRNCGEPPVPPAEWTKAVTSVGKLKAEEDPVVRHLLEEMRATVRRAHDRVLADYRRSYEQRHRVLARFLPVWRGIEQTLDGVGRALAELETRATAIDAHMDKYESILRNTERAEHMLTASLAGQFIVAAFLFAIGVAGVAMNAQLISLPLTQLVGDASVRGVPLAHSAAAAMIALQIAVGLFLMEALRLTHLFPRIGQLSDKTRRRVVGTLLSLLVLLATFNVTLAVLPNQIALAYNEMRQGLGESPMQASPSPWLSHIPMAFQIAFGFILPFALSFFAWPLEALVYSSRTLVGGALVFSLRVLGFICHAAALVVARLVSLLLAVYDVVIFIPLAIERLSARRAHPAPAGFDRRPPPAVEIDPAEVTRKPH